MKIGTYTNDFVQNYSDKYDELLKDFNDLLMTNDTLERFNDIILNIGKIIPYMHRPDALTYYFIHNEEVYSITRSTGSNLSKFIWYGKGMIHEIRINNRDFYNLIIKRSEEYDIVSIEEFTSPDLYGAGYVKAIRMHKIKKILRK